MPYWKIILHLRNGQFRSGIRKYPEEDEEKVRRVIWNQVRDTIGRGAVDFLEVIAKDINDPEVVALMFKKR